VFGDVNLSEQNIRGEHKPGTNGWPTIRYFNKSTGISGGSYVKKTSKAMCEELGNEEGMFSYVEEYGGVSLCSVQNRDRCDERSKDYIDKFMKESSDEIASEISRLEKLKSASKKPDTLRWLNHKLAVLKEIAALERDEL